MFSQMDFGPAQKYLDDDDVTDLSYSNGGQVWLKTLSKGVYRVENTGIDNTLIEKIAFQCANTMGKSVNGAKRERIASSNVFITFTSLFSTKSHLLTTTTKPFWFF